MFQVVNCWLNSAVPTDPSFSSTVLLLSGDGANASTTFTDQSFKARGNATVVDGAQVRTANPKFGTGSIRFDGNADGLAFADSADWNMGSGAFTIETWALFDTAFIENTQSLIAQWATPSQRSFGLQYSGAGATNTLNFLASSAGTAVDLNVSFNWTPTADTWYHIAADRSGNVFRLYLDGTMVATATEPMSLKDSTEVLRLGYTFSGGVAASFLKGELDEVRITKGVARYASDSGYTVPTAAFPRS